MFVESSSKPPLPLVNLLEEYCVTESQCCEKSQAIVTLLEKIKDANELSADQKQFVTQAIAAYKTQVYPYASIFNAETRRFSIKNAEGTVVVKTKGELTREDTAYLFEQVRLYHKGILPGTAVANVLAGQLWLTQQVDSLNTLLQQQKIRGKFTPKELTQLECDYFGPVQRPSRVNLLLKNMQEEIAKITGDNTTNSIKQKIDSTKIKIDSFCLHLNVYLRMREVFLTHPTLGQKYRAKYGSYENIETLEALEDRIKKQDLTKTLMPAPAVSPLASSLVSSSSAGDAATGAGQPDITVPSAEAEDAIPGLNSMGSSLLGSLWYPEATKSEEQESDKKSVIGVTPGNDLDQKLISLQQQITNINADLGGQADKINYLSAQYAQLAEARSDFFLALASYAKTVPDSGKLKTILDQYAEAFAGLKETLTAQEQTLGLPSFTYVEPDDLATFLAVFADKIKLNAEQTLTEGEKGKEKIPEEEDENPQAQAENGNGSVQAEGVTPPRYVIVTTPEKADGYVFKIRPGQTFAQLKNQLEEKCGWQDFAFNYKGVQPKDNAVVPEQGVVAKISGEQLRQALAEIKKHYAYLPDFKTEQAVKDYLTKWPLPFLLYCPEGAGEATAKIFYRDKDNKIAEAALNLAAITDQVSLKRQIKTTMHDNCCKETLRVTCKSSNLEEAEEKTQTFTVESNVANETLKILSKSGHILISLVKVNDSTGIIQQQNYYAAIQQAAQSTEPLTTEIEFEQAYKQKQEEKEKEQQALKAKKEALRKEVEIELIKQHYGYFEGLDDYTKGRAFIRAVPLRVVMSFSKTGGLSFFTRAINGGVEEKKLENVSYENAVRKFHALSAVYQGSIKYCDDKGKEATVTYQQDPDEIVLSAGPGSSVTYTEEAFYGTFKSVNLKGLKETKCESSGSWSTEERGVQQRQKAAKGRRNQKVDEANTLLTETFKKREAESTKSVDQPKKSKDAVGSSRHTVVEVKNQNNAEQNKVKENKKNEEPVSNAQAGTQKVTDQKPDYDSLNLNHANHPLYAKNTMPLYQHIAAINAAIANMQSDETVKQSIKAELKSLLDDLNEAGLCNNAAENGAGSSAAYQDRVPLSEDQKSLLLQKIDRTRQNLIKLPKVWQLFATVLGGFLGACIGLVTGAVVGAAIGGTLGTVTGPGAAVTAVTGAGAGAIAGTAGGAAAGAMVGGLVGLAVYRKWLFYWGHPVEKAVSATLDEAKQLVKRN